MNLQLEGSQALISRLKSGFIVRVMLRLHGVPFQRRELVNGPGMAPVHEC